MFHFRVRKGIFWNIFDLKSWLKTKLGLKPISIVNYTSIQYPTDPVSSSPTKNKKLHLNWKFKSKSSFKITPLLSNQSENHHKMFLKIPIPHPVSPPSSSSLFSSDFTLKGTGKGTGKTNDRSAVKIAVFKTLIIVIYSGWSSFRIDTNTFQLFTRFWSYAIWKLTKY